MRKANVVAVGKVKILKLTRKAFLEQLGNLADVVAENFKRKACWSRGPAHPTTPPAALFDAASRLPESRCSTA